MRDEFTEAVKTAVAKRVGHHCSNPGCKALTSGPCSDPAKAMNVGVAAHITAASQGGPRYDPTMTSDERGHANNAIWLCQTCAKLIDNDEKRFTVELLMKWKTIAEQEAFVKIGKTLPSESINSGEVWELVKKYLPREAACQLLMDGLTAINSFHPGYSVSASIKNGVTHILIDRKDENAPLMNIYFRPTFSDTPEDLKKKEEYASFLKDGSPVELDQSNIPYEQLPEVIKKTIPSPDSYHLYLRPSKNQRILIMDLIIQSESGETFEFHSLELKIVKSGREEITFSNWEQNIPFKIEIRLKRSAHADIVWDFNVVGQNAYWFLQTILFQKVGSKSKKMILRDTATGIEYNAGINDFICEQGPSKEFEDIARKLYYIQNKTKTLIRIPERDFTYGDFDKIEWIENILKTGKQLTAPPNITLTISDTKEAGFAKSLLEKPGQSFSSRLPMKIERILDTDIPLGQVDLFCSSILIHPEDTGKCQSFLNGGYGEASISIRLVASQGNVITATYPLWQ